MGTNSRWLVWTGPLFTVLFAVMLFGLEGETPNEKASTETVTAYFNSHRGRTIAEIFLTPLLATLLILFISHLRSLVRATADAGPTVMISGAVLWASGALFSTVTQLGLVDASRHGQPEIAHTLNVLANSSWLPFIAGIAVTLIGAGMTVLRSAVLPTWMGWVALVAGVGSLAGPGGFLGFFGGPLWVLVAGILLMKRSPASAEL